MIFESHAHYDDRAFDEDRAEILNSMKVGGVGYIVNISASLTGIESTLALTKEYPFIYGTVGVHPDEVRELNEETFAWMRKQSKADKVVAIGEIGLDYYWDKAKHEIQKKWFVRQMELAKERNLPIVVHSRDAAEDTLKVMKEFHAEELRGVIHCFSYGKEMAREYLDMGYYIGIGGVITFKNGKKLKEVVEYMPLDRILLETDCPYLSPEPYRGKRNSSLNLTYVVKEIARLKNVTEEEVIAITEKNAKELYFKGDKK